MSGHAKSCDCLQCAKFRVSEYIARINDTSRAAPESADQTVPVRAHWRRHPNHLTKFPATRGLLKRRLAELMKERAS